MKHGFYNRFFQDWAEVPVLSGEDKYEGLKRVYVGDYYSQALSTGRYIAVRVCHLLLFALSLTLFVYAARLDTISNTVLLVALPTAASGLALLCLLLSLGFYIFAKREMTVGEYWESSLLLRMIAGVAAICLGCCVLFTLLCAARHPMEYAAEELKAALCFALAALAALAMRLVEKKVPYRMRPSGNARPDGSLRI